VTTIARLVTAVEADPRGLTRGLQQSSSEIRRFTTTLEREMKRLPVLNIVTPTMLKHLQNVKGDLEKATAAANRLNEAAGRTAQSFAKMRASAALLRDEGLARQIRTMDPFQGGMGGSMSRAQSSGFGQGMAAGNISRALGVMPAVASPQAAGGISRTQGALIALMFTMTNFGEQLAATDTKWGKLEKTVGTALQAISGIALMFGPSGRIVSGIAIVASFIMDFFAQTREEADRTARSMEDSMKRLIDSADSAAMMTKLRDLDYGAPSAGNSTADPRAFKGGLMDLEAQLAQQKAALRTANFATVLAIQDSIESLEKQLAPLRAQREQLVAAIMNPRSAPALSGAGAVSVTASAPRGADDLLGDLEARAGALIGLHRELATQSRVDLDLNVQLLHIYDELGVRLNGMSDKWGKSALSVKRIRADLEGIIGNPALAKLLSEIGAPGKTSGTDLSSSFRAPGMPSAGGATAAPLAAGTPGMMDKLNAYIVQPFAEFVTPALTAFGSALGPASLLLRALAPAFEVLEPLLNNLVAPLAAVAMVIVQGLEPAFKLLFPIIKAIAIVFSFVAEVIQRVNAAIVRAIGNFLIAVGAVIRKLSFGFAGKGIQRLGDSLLQYSDEAKQSADKMMRTRENLERMQWGDTAAEVTGLGDAARATAEALRNVPTIWKVELARWRAAQFATPAGPGGSAPPSPVVPSSTPRRPLTPPESPNLVSGASGGAAIVFHGDVTITTEARNGEELWDGFVRAARRESLRRTGRSGDGWMRGV
jgi:hypothetical protein